MQQQLENLKESYKLSSQQVKDAVNPLEVAALFEKNQVSYVLIGSHERIILFFRSVSLDGSSV